MTALIETVRLRDGAAPLWYLHLRRLAASCTALGIPLPGTLLTPAGGPDRVYRLEVGPRGLTTSERPVGPVRPVALAVGSGVHRPYPHKTTDRAQFDRALEEARSTGADDALMFAEGGFVAEAAIWAIFWWEGTELCAPTLDLGILPSVARARLEEIAGRIGERRIKMDRIRGRSLFVANAVRGVVPVSRLGGEPVPSEPETERLAGLFWS